MEIIDKLAEVVGVLLFYGWLIIALCLLAMVLVVAGFGLLATYVLHNLTATVAPPLEDAQGNHLDYYIINVQVNHGGISYFSAVWYLVDVQAQFAGVAYVITPTGQDIKNDLDPAELERISDIAEHAWEVSIGQP